MQQTIEAVFQELVQHKELFGIPATILGAARTLWSFVEARSLESRRDKLLSRISALGTVMQLVRQGDVMAAADSDVAYASLRREVDATIDELTHTIEQVRDREIETEGLGFAQRALLLYKPANWRGWIAHVLCWLSAACIPLYLFGVGTSDETGEFSFAAFKEAWSRSDTYGGLLLLLGVFLLARLWGTFERKRRLAFEKKITGQHKGIGIGAALAWVYAAAGVALAVWGIAIGGDDLRAGVALAVFGLMALLCGIPFKAWSKLRSGQPVSHWWENQAILFAPAILLVLMVIFNFEGVVLSRFRGDIVAYWRSWLHDPTVPLVVLPIAIVPTVAALRALHHRKMLPKERLASSASTLSDNSSVM